MLLTLNLSCPLHNSFRVQQIAGMFDVPLADKLREQFTLDLPDEFFASLPCATGSASDSSDPKEHWHSQCHPLTTDHRSLATAWQLGLILGPSASGKTTLARHLLGQNLVERFDWPRDKAIIDGLSVVSGPSSVSTDNKERTTDKPTIHDLTRLLTSVGLSSPPAWIKPFHVLSTGEQFRANLARAIVVAVEQSKSGKVEKSLRRFNSSTFGPCPLVAIDEFSSTLDRRVACLASAALAKSIRAGRIPVRFVAITCHADILRWLAPDWTIDMSTRQFTWRGARAGCQVSRCQVSGPKQRKLSNKTPDDQATTHQAPTAQRRRRLHRPKIRVTLHRSTPDHWPTFARHHYLSAALNKSARCYIVVWEKGAGRRAQDSVLRPAPCLLRPELVAFCATLPLIGRRNHYRVHRLVVLLDFQGLGLGPRVLEAVADLHRAEGKRINITASHPALIAHCRASPNWRTVKIMPTGIRPSPRFAQIYRGSTGRAVVSFEYRGAPAEHFAQPRGKATAQNSSRWATRRMNQKANPPASTRKSPPASSAATRKPRTRQDQRARKSKAPARRAER
jgi:GNAT superfamily N-acetyltransferase